MCCFISFSLCQSSIVYYYCSSIAAVVEPYFFVFPISVLLFDVRFDPVNGIEKSRWKEFHEQR